MSRPFGSLLCCWILLLSYAVHAAPAPFSKPLRASPKPLTTEQVKQILLYDHGIQIEFIGKVGATDVWMVKGTVAVPLQDGRTLYTRKFYQVIASQRGERGKNAIKLRDLSIERHAFIR